MNDNNEKESHSVFQKVTMPWAMETRRRWGPGTPVWGNVRRQYWVWSEEPH